MHRARATVFAQIQLLLLDPLAASMARERRSARKGGESTGRASARSRTDYSPLASRRSPTSRARGAGRHRLEEREQGTHSHSRVKRRAYLGSLRKNFSTAHIAAARAPVPAVTTRLPSLRVHTDGARGEGTGGRRSSGAGGSGRSSGGPAPSARASAV